MVDEKHIDELSERIVKEFHLGTGFAILTRAAVDFHYPGESADQSEASESFEIATRMRATLRSLLGI